MSEWLRKLRGLLGFGLSGAVAGGVVGGLWWACHAVLGLDEVAFGSLGWAVGLWSGFGAFGMIGAGALLATAGLPSSRRTLSPRRLAAFGVLMGLLPPPVLIVLTGGSWSLGVAVVAGLNGLLGGLVGGGLVVIAERSHDAELGAADELRAIRPGG